MIKIKENIIIYFSQTYQDLLQQLIEVINNNKNTAIIQYKEGNIKSLLNECEKLETKSNEISKIKNFLLFNTIYEMNASNDENKNYEIANKILKDIFMFGFFLLLHSISILAILL